MGGLGFGRVHTHVAPNLPPPADSLVARRPRDRTKPRITAVYGAKLGIRNSIGFFARL
jgi:hypothetical protein